MIRNALFVLVILLVMSVGVFGNDTVVVSFATDDDVTPWEVTYHQPEDGFNMNHNITLVEADALVPLGVSKAMQYTFDLRSAWASVERPLELGGQDVQEIVLYLWVNDATRVMVMEAYEKSNTRWRAKIRLQGNTWNEVILRPLDFFYLLGGEDRGGFDDMVILSELNRIGFTVDGHEIDMGAKEIQIGMIVFR